MMCQRIKHILATSWASSRLHCCPIESQYEFGDSNTKCQERATAQIAQKPYKKKIYQTSNKTSKYLKGSSVKSVNALSLHLKSTNLEMLFVDKQIIELSDSKN